MKALRISTVLCICFVLGVALFAATVSADGRPELAASIQADIANLSCDTDDDCSFIPFGSKPCGGPWNYKLFSRKTTDERALWAKIERYNKMDAYYNEKNGLQSDCNFIVPPTMSCVNSMCNGSASHSKPY